MKTNSDFFGLQQIPTLLHSELTYIIQDEIDKLKTHININIYNINKIDELGLSLLQHAIYLKNTKAVSIILKHPKIDVNQVTVDENESEVTALSCAIDIRDPDMMKLLIEHGANVLLPNDLQKLKSLPIDIRKNLIQSIMTTPDNQTKQMLFCSLLEKHKYDLIKAYLELHEGNLTFPKNEHDSVRNLLQNLLKETISTLDQTTAELIIEIENQLDLLAKEYLAEHKIKIPNYFTLIKNLLWHTNSADVNF